MQNDTLHLISGAYTSALWESLEEVLTDEDSPEYIYRVLKALHDHEDSGKMALSLVRILYDIAGIDIPCVALHDVVKLKHDRPDLGIKSSFLGAVVDILDGGCILTVEFVDENGDTIDTSIYTYFKYDELEFVSRNAVIR